MDGKELIARRVAGELKGGFYVNIGIGATQRLVLIMLVFSASYTGCASGWLSRIAPPVAIHRPKAPLTSKRKMQPWRSRVYGGWCLFHTAFEESAGS